MEIVAAGLGDRIDHATHGTAELGAVTASVDRHLVQELDREVRSAAQAGGVAVDVTELRAGDVDPVDQIYIFQAGCSGDGDAAGAVDERTRCLLDDVAEIARSGYWCCTCCRRLLQPRVADIDCRRPSRDDVGLLGRGGGRLAGDACVDPNCLLGRNDHAALLGLGRRVRHVKANHVGADGQRREVVVAGVTGQRGVVTLGSLNDR